MGRCRDRVLLVIGVAGSIALAVAAIHRFYGLLSVRPIQPWPLPVGFRWLVAMYVGLLSAFPALLMAGVTCIDPVKAGLALASASLAAVAVELASVWGLDCAHSWSIYCEYLPEFVGLAKLVVVSYSMSSIALLLAWLARGGGGRA